GDRQPDPDRDRVLAPAPRRRGPPAGRPRRPAPGRRRGRLPKDSEPPLPARDDRQHGCPTLLPAPRPPPPRRPRRLFAPRSRRGPLPEVAAAPRPAPARLTAERARGPRGRRDGRGRLGRPGVVRSGTDLQ